MFHVTNIRWTVMAMKDNENDNKFSRQFITIFRTIPVEKKDNKILFDCDKKDIMMGLMYDILQDMNGNGYYYHSLA